MLKRKKAQHWSHTNYFTYKSFIITVLQDIAIDFSIKNLHTFQNIPLGTLANIFLYKISQAHSIFKHYLCVKC